MGAGKISSTAFETIREGEGWREERTGLHELEFIETRRHWFTGTVPHDTGGGVNVLNLVRATRRLSKAPPARSSHSSSIMRKRLSFPPLSAPTPFVLTAFPGKKCATIKAFVRTDP